MNFILIRSLRTPLFFFFFFNDTATTEIYTLSLHDALPISTERACSAKGNDAVRMDDVSLCSSTCTGTEREDRKSTRLNSSHDQISYAVFCLKKKKKRTNTIHRSSTSTSLNTWLRIHKRVLD